MRKLVLGIIALVSVQFAFVTYMMVLQSPIELTNDAAPTQPGPSTPDLVRIDRLNNSAEVVRQPEVPISRNESPNTSTRRAATNVDLRTTNRISKHPPYRAPSKTAGPIKFENVVIRYNRSPDTTDCEIRDAPKSKKKRSFLAKAAPVITKPWDWIKSVGSKLN